MKKFFSFIDKFTDAVGVVSLCVMCVVIFIQVVARYLFASSAPWPEEAGRFSFLVCTYAGITYCMRHDGHLRVLIIPQLYPRLKKAFEFIHLTATVIYLVLSAQLLITVFRKVYRIGAKAVTMPIPLWSLWAIIIFFCLATLLAVIRLYFVKDVPADEPGAD